MREQSKAEKKQKTNLPAVNTQQTVTLSLLIRHGVLA